MTTKPSKYHICVHSCASWPIRSSVIHDAFVYFWLLHTECAASTYKRAVLVIAGWYRSYAFFRLTGESFRSRIIPFVDILHVYTRAAVFAPSTSGRRRNSIAPTSAAPAHDFSRERIERILIQYTYYYYIDRIPFVRDAYVHSNILRLCSKNVIVNGRAR